IPAFESRRVRTQPLTVTGVSLGACPARISRTLKAWLFMGAKGAQPRRRCPEPAGKLGWFETNPHRGLTIVAYRGIHSEMVTIKGHGSVSPEAYYARPNGSGPFPGMVVIHHAPGWDEWITEVVRKFAHHGHIAIAPNLYFREGPGSPDDQAAKARGA